MVGGTGGMAAWDGAILLQWSQAARVACMSVVMPGQKIEASALAIIWGVPWWAACRKDRHVFLRACGTMIRSLYTATPSDVVR